MSDPFAEAELKAQNDIEAELLKEFRTRCKYIELTTYSDLEKSYENARTGLSRAFTQSQVITYVVQMAISLLAIRRLKDTRDNKKDE